MPRGDSMPYVPALRSPSTTSAATGMPIVSLMCIGSTTSTPLIALDRTPHDGQTLFGSTMRSRLTLAAAASNGMPSENTAPGRSVNVQLSASGASCHAVARLGWILPSGPTRPNDSTTLWTTLVTVVVVRPIGSGAPPIAAVSVVCWSVLFVLVPPNVPHDTTRDTAATTRPSNRFLTINTPLQAGAPRLRAESSGLVRQMIDERVRPGDRATISEVGYKQPPDEVVRM